MATSTPATRIGVRRIAGRIGAEITGADLTDDLDDASVAEIRQALLTHRVVFFRGPDIGHARHIAFGRRFGELTRRPGTKHGVAPDGFPEILTVDPKADVERYGGDFEEHYRRKWVSPLAGWHSDLTQAVNPPDASILRAETTPQFGGDTQWTNTVAAYEGLSRPLRDLLDSLQAEHAFFTGVHLRHSDERDREILKIYCEDPQVAVHPVVRVHPETGEKALFVSPGSTTRIVGFSELESRRLLDLLFEQLTSAEYTVRFRWEPGSIAFWDNRTTCHLAPTDFAQLGVDRVMHRVTLLGQPAVGPDGFTSRLVAGEPLRAW
ncbi:MULTISPECIES: TauD/TfdA family dioxygenase [unclassified Streptomyces]|uniref:TauD/TfdA dioxygenase family protein n=1 Tax=unclassified Streptomyces TaxID=2593676 RepID=UPI002E817A82|nr:TauD/TfdA family dioxygenase [Streptomyces sp. NBC_00589]WTI35279.1 TauD/TfdA family dioxygenase [Streptomyces sp. NBC_00775]WUB31047.1 TauD/TfdA family dioxygenase [Streptomyces sp. NBC_00589]